MTTIQAYPDSVGLYEQLAPRYDQLHRRWLRHAGGEAQSALEAAVRSLAVPGSSLLDAGCGTGAFARRLIAEGMLPMGITLVDPSAAMLARCDDIPVPKVKARLANLPFPSGAFDIVTCAWVLETVPDQNRALSELCRMVRPGGALCLAFCADRPGQGLVSWIMKRALRLRGSGRLLSTQTVAAAITARHPEFETRILPCAGAAAALIAFRRAS